MTEAMGHPPHHTTDACWAVIRERFLQLIYGFYPPESYWRINLTMVLMLVALAPILFTSLPRMMLWFSAIFPALAFFAVESGVRLAPTFGGCRPPCSLGCRTGNQITSELFEFAAVPRVYELVVGRLIVLSTAS